MKYGAKDMELVLYKHKRPFIKVDPEFLESDILKDCYQKVVYIYLKALADDRGRCSPGIKELSRMMKISVNKVKATINELIQMGLVEKQHRIRADGGSDSNLYTIHDLSEISNYGYRLDGKKVFIVIDKEFFENSQLDSCQQKLVYLCLSRLADVRGECYPSVKELSGLTKIGISKVKSTINELEQKGMVNKKKIKACKRIRNLYILSYNYVSSFGMVHDKGTGRYLEDYGIFGFEPVNI